MRLNIKLYLTLENGRWWYQNAWFRDRWVKCDPEKIGLIETVDKDFIMEAITHKTYYVQKLFDQGLNQGVFI